MILYTRRPSTPVFVTPSYDAPNLVPPSYDAEGEILQHCHAPPVMHAKATFAFAALVTLSSMICRNFATPWKVSCLAMSATMKAPCSPRNVLVARLPSFFSDTCASNSSSNKRSKCLIFN